MTRESLTARLERLAAELAAITTELRGRPQAWTPGPRAAQALDILRALGPVPRSQWVYDLIERHGFGQSVAYEHARRLIQHGMVQVGEDGTVSVCSVNNLL